MIVDDMIRLDEKSSGKDDVGEDAKGVCVDGVEASGRGGGGEGGRPEGKATPPLDKKRFEWALAAREGGLGAPGLAGRLLVAAATQMTESDIVGHVITAAAFI